MIYHTRRPVILQRELRTLGHVPRWAIIRTIQRQNVLEHTALVAIYADQIANFIQWDPDDPLEWYRLIAYALRHDWEEEFTSDIPHPVKAMGIDRQMFSEFIREQMTIKYPMDIIHPSNDIKAIVRVADLIEGVMFLLSEARMGNSEVRGQVDFVRDQMWLAVEVLPCDADAKALVRQEIQAAFDYEETGFSGLSEEDGADPRDLHERRAAE